MGKASADYLSLRTLMNSGYRIQKITINIADNSAATKIELKGDKGDIQTLESHEDDVAMLGFRWKQMYDKSGKPVQGFVKDTNALYEQVDYFLDPDHKKAKAAGEKIRNGECKIDFVPHDLIERFLDDPNPTWKKYIPLRESYYEIVWLHTVQIKELYDAEQNLKKQGDQVSKRLLLISELLSKAFRNTPNFLNNYQRFQSYCITDIYELLQRAGEQITFTKHQFSMLEKQDGMPVDVGLRYVIEDYASKGEILIKLMNILRAAIEIIEGSESSSLRMKSMRNWEIIRKHPKYGEIIGTFDPRIRHGKAHQAYEIDAKTRTIRFYQEGRIKKLLVEYDFNTFQAMWHELPFVLKTVMVAVSMEHAASAALMLRSGEYKSLLLSLGNFQPE